MKSTVQLNDTQISALNRLAAFDGACNLADFHGATVRALTARELVKVTPATAKKAAQIKISAKGKKALSANSN